MSPFWQTPKKHFSIKKVMECNCPLEFWQCCPWEFWLWVQSRCKVKGFMDCMFKQYYSFFIHHRCSLWFKSWLYGGHQTSDEFQDFVRIGQIHGPIQQVNWSTCKFAAMKQFVQALENFWMCCLNLAMRLCNKSLM